MLKGKTYFEQILEAYPLARDAFDLAKEKVLPFLPKNRKSEVKLDRAQGYIWRVVQRIGHLADRLAAMDQAIIFISSYQVSKRWKDKHSRTAYLKYHNEAFVTNVIAVFDRCLHLIAVIFDLGIPERRVNRFFIAENTHVSKSAVAKPLLELVKTLESKGLLKLRNEQLHMTSYSDDALELLEMVEILSNHPDDVSRDAHLWSPEALKFRHSDYAYFRQRECDNIAKEVRKNCGTILDALHVEFKLKIKLKEIGIA